MKERDWKRGIVCLCSCDCLFVLFVDVFMRVCFCVSICISMCLYKRIMEREREDGDIDYFVCGCFVCLWLVCISPSLSLFV